MKSQGGAAAFATYLIEVLDSAIASGKLAEEAVVVKVPDLIADAGKCEGWECSNRQYSERQYAENGREDINHAYSELSRIILTEIDARGKASVAEHAHYCLWILMSGAYSAGHYGNAPSASGKIFLMSSGVAAAREALAEQRALQHEYELSILSDEIAKIPGKKTPLKAIASAMADRLGKRVSEKTLGKWRRELSER
ncbi:hypothetical protein MPC4_70083 [Methylocella tundrae]|uniref:Uncharacterized protein n=1 Tax=Methylocella tundrae TaxID=227605 RepID=A0A8B6MCB3_METTU|nr:hypothetical protein [Methylocella tundrae]VTZ28463.1 hypothetical protein MPC1_910010 [Methylocella tundrae]VTZ52195.1 hypothetical protein MPC4_70083 [Methylocella tundrae]